MATLSRILARKGDRILDITDNASLVQAAQAMAGHGVGALAVRRDGTIVGVVSERDLVLLLARLGGAAASTPVGEAMQAAVEISADADLNQGLEMMTDRRRRHLLVRQEDQIVGLLSIGDLVKALHEEQVGTISSLHQYITG